MNKPAYLMSAALLCTAIPTTSVYADGDDNEREHDDTELCMGAAPAILSVADFDGNGIVNTDDITILKKARKRDRYIAFYDINADGELNRRDIHHAESDLGKSSTRTDRQKAMIYHQLKQLEYIDNKPELVATQYMMIAQSLAGHGEHWFHNMNHTMPNGMIPGGVNYSAERNRVMGVYWSMDAIPVFEGGATDYPTPGGEWMTQRVVAFDGHPPKVTDSPDETWHTHAGLCVTAIAGPNGPLPELHQHTSFAECQALPTLFKTMGDVNAWFNIWMLHAWTFDLNPNGYFANTHPCADPDSPAEHTINEGRTVPEFFQMHH